MKRGFSQKYSPIAGGCLSLLLLVALVLMNRATYLSESFDNLYYPLLIINSGGLILLFVLIAMHLLTLWRQLRAKVSGSRLKLRMVIYATVLVMAPVAVVYYFSLDFLRRGIDSWFNLQVEEALDDALVLSREALDIRMRETLTRTKQAASSFQREPNTPLAVQMDGLREQLNASELTLFDRHGTIVVASSDTLTELVPSLIDETIQTQLRQNSDYISLDPVSPGEMAIRAVVNLSSTNIEEERYMMQVLFPLAPRINELVGNVQDGLLEYKKVSYLRDQLKISFILVLTLVLLFTIFGGIWGGLIIVDNLLKPIQRLVRGTQQVAIGDYETRLPVTSDDELGFLVSSFNDMIGKVAASQQKVEAQRTFLETILSRISSGVMVLNQERELITFNASLSHLLELSLSEKEKPGITMTTLAADHPEQAHILTAIEKQIKSDEPEWHIQLHHPTRSGSRILRCNGTLLPSLPETGQGYIIVIDDITAIVHSQREAAWNEVARRLAHEINNPLTPIQLSAERLRNKYMPLLREEDNPSLLDRLTTTIVQQVNALRDMLNAFTNYASPLRIEHSDVNLNRLITQTVELYQDNQPSVSIELEMGEVPSIRVDEGKLRQVLHNLIRNALDASMDNNGKLQIMTHSCTINNRPGVEIRITDTGHGLPDDMQGHLFEPYVTTKTKGTGLGLAIVKKIVEDHDGTIWIENNDPPPGVCVTVRLPVIATKMMIDSTEAAA